MQAVDFTLGLYSTSSPSAMLLVAMKQVYINAASVSADITGLLTTATKANVVHTIVLSGLTIACGDPAVGHAQQRSQAAWCIYTAACGSGQVVNSQAQCTLWKLQTGTQFVAD